MKTDAICSDNAVDLRWDDYPGNEEMQNARMYLSLLCSPRKVEDLALRLDRAELVLFRAPFDIIRAAGVNLAPQTETKVLEKIRYIHSKKVLSPILTIRSKHNSRIHIADGYYTLCAIHYLSPDTKVPTIVTDWENE